MKKNCHLCAANVKTHGSPKFCAYTLRETTPDGVCSKFKAKEKSPAQRVKETLAAMKKGSF